ncbi:MAG: hypothetical protein K2Y28_07740 [Burkholderiaceae bacterium]|nr:hypothetical protein [Burkholderiaceae bacterium]
MDKAPFKVGDTIEFCGERVVVLAAHNEKYGRVRNSYGEVVDPFYWVFGGLECKLVISGESSSVTLSQFEIDKAAKNPDVLRALAEEYDFAEVESQAITGTFNSGSNRANQLRAEAARIDREEAGILTFQASVEPWMQATFGAEISADPIERNHRYLEESLELVQSCGCTASEAHQLVDYVFNRPVGEKFQEVGGVMVTLAALCLAQKIDMHDAGKVELARVWTMIEKIRAKQASKPKHSPLPEFVPQPSTIVVSNKVAPALNMGTPVSVIGFPTSVVDGSDSTKLFFDSPQINTTIKP